MVGKEYYNNAYPDASKYKCHYSESVYYPIWVYILGLIGNERILEGGCGTGQFAQMLIENKKNYKLGIDFSKEAIKIAKKLNLKNEEKFKIGDLLDEINIDYDLFLCLEVLEHIDNDIEVLRKVEKGKRVILSVPNFNDPAHVRLFKDKSEIIRRYRNILSIKNIKTFIIRGKSVIFAVDSIKI